MHLLLICGTNRQDSLTRPLVAWCAQQLAALPQVTFDSLDMAELGPEFLAANAYKQPTPAIQALVQRFLAADGVVFFVPEYNGS